CLAALVLLMERQQFTNLAESPGQEVLHLPAIHEISVQFSILCEGHSHANPFFERCRILTLAAMLFDSIFKSLPQAAAPIPPNFTAQSRFLEIVQKMPATEMLVHTPSELAQLCRCSVTRFRRLF